MLELDQKHENSTIQNDIEAQNLNTKIKLLEEALTRRNVDVEQAEENNRQLLTLLEKYDNKLDELQEDNELKDMKIFEYERNHLGDRPKIRIEAIEDKVRFLVQVLKRLKQMYIDGVKERIAEVPSEHRDNLEYPLLPESYEDAKPEVDASNLTLEQQADHALDEIYLIENNRAKRELLEGEQSLSQIDQSKQDHQELKKNMEEQMSKSRSTITNAQVQKTFSEDF
jgi:chromosome segregation ATPase